jgi:hypothetical protein
MVFHALSGFRIPGDRGPQVTMAARSSRLIMETIVLSLSVTPVRVLMVGKDAAERDS